MSSIKSCTRNICAIYQIYIVTEPKYTGIWILVHMLQSYQSVILVYSIQYTVYDPCASTLHPGAHLPSMSSLGHITEARTAARWVWLTLQVYHHHLLFVLDFAEILRLFLLLCQLRSHLIDPLLQQLFLLLGTIKVWLRTEALRHTVTKQWGRYRESE